MAALVSVAGMLLLAMPGGASGQAVPPAGFDVFARADALRLDLTAAKFPVLPNGEILQVSPATTQASVNSFGESIGFATAPTPGDPIPDLIGAVNGLGAGGIPKMPSYPFVVRTAHPSVPQDSQAVGPYAISAKSDAEHSEASASFGAVSGSPRLVSSEASALASIDPETNTLVADARSSVTAFSLGPVLSIGDIDAHAHLTADPGEDPVYTSSFAVGSLSIGGIKVGITDKGLEPLGIPLADLGVSVLDTVLANAGVDFEMLPSETTDSRIVSAGLRISYSVESPVIGTTTVTQTFGRVSVGISVQEPLAPSTPLPSTPAGAVGGTPDSGSFGGPAAAVSPDLALPPVTTGDVRVSTPTPSSSLSPGSVRTVAVPLDPRISDRTAKFYLVLVVLGALAIVGSRLIGAAVTARYLPPRSHTLQGPQLRLPSPSA